MHAGNADLVIRGGYALELSPSPGADFLPQRTANGMLHMIGDSTVLTPLRILDNDRHVLTAGFGLVYRLSETERVRIDLWGQLHALVDRRYAITQTATMPDTSMSPPPGMLSTGFIVVGGWMIGLEF